MEKDALKSFGHALRLGKYNRLNRELSDVVRQISVFFYLSKNSTRQFRKKTRRNTMPAKLFLQKNLKFMGFSRVSRKWTFEASGPLVHLPGW